MNRFLNVGGAPSKIVWHPGSRQVEITAVAAIRGSFAVRIVPKNEPKLVPVTRRFPADRATSPPLQDRYRSSFALRRKPRVAGSRIARVRQSPRQLRPVASSGHPPAPHSFL